MSSFALKMFAVIALLCVVQHSVAGNVEHTRTWGDLSGGDTIFATTKTKSAIPFLVRDTEISFPGVSFDLISNISSKLILFQ